LEQGYGYIGILVSWLAGHNPLLVLAMSVFYGVLLQGGAALQMAGVEPSLVLILQATMILFGLGSLTYVHYSLRKSTGPRLKNLGSHLRARIALGFARDPSIRCKPH
jgi:ABC-type uncharacterized transport system permease subunit